MLFYGAVKNGTSTILYMVPIWCAAYFLLNFVFQLTPPKTCMKTTHPYVRACAMYMKPLLIYFLIAQLIVSKFPMSDESEMLFLNQQNNLAKSYKVIFILCQWLFWFIWWIRQCSQRCILQIHTHWRFSLWTFLLWVNSNLILIIDTCTTYHIRLWTKSLSGRRFSWLCTWTHEPSNYWYRMPHWNPTDCCGHI